MVAATSTAMRDRSPLGMAPDPGFSVVLPPAAPLLFLPCKLNIFKKCQSLFHMI
jgi:hypothetical protein